MGNRAHHTEKTEDRGALGAHPEDAEKTEHCWVRGAHQLVPEEIKEGLC